MGSQTPLMPFFHALARAEIGPDFPFLKIRHALAMQQPPKTALRNLGFFCERVKGYILAWRGAEVASPAQVRDKGEPPSG